MAGRKTSLDESNSGASIEQPPPTRTKRAKTLGSAAEEENVNLRAELLVTVAEKDKELAEKFLSKAERDNEELRKEIAALREKETALATAQAEKSALQERTSALQSVLQSALREKKTALQEVAALREKETALATAQAEKTALQSVLQSALREKETALQEVVALREKETALATAQAEKSALQAVLQDKTSALQAEKKAFNKKIREERGRAKLAVDAAVRKAEKDKKAYDEKLEILTHHRDVAEFRASESQKVMERHSEKVLQTFFNASEVAKIAAIGANAHVRACDAFLDTLTSPRVPPNGLIAAAVHKPANVGLLSETMTVTFVAGSTLARIAELVREDKWEYVQGIRPFPVGLPDDFEGMMRRVAENGESLLTKRRRENEVTFGLS
jgi:hypothetical protein